MAAHRARRGAWRVHEHGVDAGRAQRRRLKIGRDAPNRHSRSGGRFGEPTDALVPRVTGQDSSPRHFESDGFTAGRGAGVVGELTRPNGRETRDEGVGGILNDESTLRVTW